MKQRTYGNSIGIMIKFSFISNLKTEILTSVKKKMDGGSRNK